MQMEGRVPSCSLSTFLWGSGRLEELKKNKEWMKMVRAVEKTAFMRHLEPALR